MQRNRDGLWSLGATGNGGSGNGNRNGVPGGYVPEATRVFSNYNQQPITRYNFHTQAQQNLNFPHHRQLPSFPPHQFGPNVEAIRIDKAVNETRKSLVAGGQSVSSTRVWQSVLAQLQVRSFGVPIEDVPSLRQLMALEGKINAFIHCFIGARLITTLHDLEAALCRNEFVDCFEDLELGPLLQHPLVLLYFPSISGFAGPVQITSEEIISFLDSYLITCDTDDVKPDEFLNFVAEKKSITSKEKLGVRIQSLGMYVSFIQEAKRQEGETLKISLAGLHQKHHTFSSKKQRKDVSLNDSEHADSFALHHKDHSGKHARFDSSSSDDNDSADNKVEYVNNSEHFSSCPYPSVAEEMKRLGGSKKKRKAESRNHEKSNSSKQLRRCSSRWRRGHAKQEIPKSADDSGVKQVFSVSEADFTLSEGALRLFVSTWKEKCKELSMSTLIEKILSFYDLGGSEVRDQDKRAKAMSSFPFAGLLHVARELVREALEEKIPIETTDTKLVAGYNNCAGTSSRPDKPNSLRPTMPMKSSSTLVPEWNNSASTEFSVRDELNTSTTRAAQAQQTGKKGEEIAYRYFAAKYGNEALVRWVNKESETGLPYDLVIENRGGKKEYVEVKATVCTRKDYFNLTVKEWEFAQEEGDSYVIAHVLLGNSNAILTQHRNVVKLCQQGHLRFIQKDDHLRLVVLTPNQRNEVNVPF